MKTWLREHRLALASASARLGAQKSATLASILAIGIALALPFGGYTLLEPLRALAGRIALEPQLTLYMRADAPRGDTHAVHRALRGDARIADLRAIPREAALKELAELEGFSEIVALLETNPLPDAFVIRPRDASPEAIEKLAAELRGVPNVARVQADSLWAKRLAALAGLGRLMLVFLATLLAFGLIAVTFNTIRLQILTLRVEVEVSKLLGATDRFIRRPYCYAGALQGMLGGALALAIVGAGVHLLNQQVRVLAESYGSSFRVPFPSWADAASVVLFAGFLGWLGAHLSVSRHLREMEP